MPTDDLWRLSATEAVQLLAWGEVTPGEMVEAAIARIEAVDGQVNALPIRCFERAREQAGAIGHPEPLFGLPIAVKDYNDVGGVRTTYGSPIFADHPAGSRRMTKTTDPVDAARLALLLSELRLPAIKAGWKHVADRADKEGWPAARFLATLAEHEVAERARRRIERHLNEARLPPGKTLESFDFNAVPHDQQGSGHGARRR